MRNVYYKYYHPKEALVSNGVLNRAISQAAGKGVTSAEDDSLNSQYVHFCFDKNKKSLDITWIT